MPLSNLIDFGLKTLHNKAFILGAGLALGYHVTPERFKPHPIHDVADASGEMMMMPGMWSNYMSDETNYFMKPAIGGALFPHAYMPQFQWGLSALSHEDLNARYGGPNPNSDAALFENNFDNSTGAYVGPTVGSSIGARSSALNLGANGSMVFGMHNNRLR